MKFSKFSDLLDVILCPPLQEWTRKPAWKILTGVTDTTDHSDSSGRDFIVTFTSLGTFCTRSCCSNLKVLIVEQEITISELRTV